MKASKLLVLIATLGLIMVFAGELQAAPRYRIFYNDTPGAGSQSKAINDNGQVVVNSPKTPNFPYQLYLWTPGSKEGVLIGSGSQGYGINNLGQIVGEHFMSATNSSACLWDANNPYYSENLGVVNDAPRNIALSINDSGVAIGVSILADNSMLTWTWTKASGIQPLDLQGGIAYKILNDGRMVGQKNNHAWLWNAPGAGQDLGTLPAPFNGASIASDINQKGQVVGWATNPNPPSESASRAFSWTQSGGLKDLGTLGGQYSRALAINKDGYIAGWAGTTTPGYFVGCLWTPKGDKIYLDQHLVNPNPTGRTVIYCTGINAKRVIVGYSGGPFMLLPTSNLAAISSILLPAD